MFPSKVSLIEKKVSSCDISSRLSTEGGKNSILKKIRHISEAFADQNDAETVQVIQQQEMALFAQRRKTPVNPEAYGIGKTHSDQFEEDIIVSNVSFKSPSIPSLMTYTVTSYPPEISVYEQFKKERVNIFTAAAIICTLEDCIDKLSIVGFMRNKPQEEPPAYIKSLNERLLQHHPQKIFEGQSMERFDKYIENYRINKMQKDRKLVENVLSNTIFDLKIQQRFIHLLDSCEQIEKIPHEEQQLIDEERRHQMELATLQRRITKEKKQLEKKIRKASIGIKTVKDGIEDLGMENEIKTRAVVKWENARKSQNKHLNVLKENQSIAEATHSCQKMEQEVRIHMEISKYIQLVDKEFRDGTADWITRYDTDIEQIELDITKIKNNIEVQREAVINIGNEIAAKQNLMDEWVAHKEEMRRHRELMEKMERAATLIQAWWKGIMLRQGKGPYKKIAKFIADMRKKKFGKK